MRINKQIFISLIALVSLLSCKPKIKNNFVDIFDGKTLHNWHGDSTYWHVENGSLVGTVTPETILKRNTFIIWQGGQPENFELKLSYRISKLGNSGINYRSELIKNKPFALRGYQADIDGKNKYTGQNYEEKKRTTLAYQGEKVIINTQNNPNVSGNLRTNIKKNCWQTRQVIHNIQDKETLKKAINNTGWNHVHIIAQGKDLKHYVNGILTSHVIDNDNINRSLKGLIGVQVHVGPPMSVAFKDIKLKQL